METSLKIKIKDAAASYMLDKKISQTELAGIAGINGSYLSAIMNGVWHTGPEDKLVPIVDKWLIKLADAVGVSTKRDYWKTVMTPQMLHIISALQAAKETGATATLICPTGLGKTFVVEKFYAENPKYTYVITVNSLMKLHDVVNGLLRLMGIPEKGSKAMRLINIIMKLRDIKRAGGKPQVIIDEGENMELAVVKMIKGLFDGVRDYTSIVLIGTDQLSRKMEWLKNSNENAGPQFYRRFKAGIRQINPIADFTPFFAAMGVTEPGLQKLLGQLCDNYGELHDYLEPAMREADARGQELTEDFFRLMYQKPKAA